MKDWLANEIDSPVYIGNDANAFVLGEYCFGAGKGYHSVFGITLGTGVGGGMVLNGQLQLGANQAAGEIGHTTINVFGPKCKCGNRGCLERYVGAEYIVARMKKRLKLASFSDQREFMGVQNDCKNISPKTIFLAAKRGDKLAKTIVEETGTYLGAGLANLISLLDPAIIIIGGGVSGFGKLLLDSVKESVAERIMNFPGRKIRIVLSKLRDDAAILGASQLAKFNEPGLATESLRPKSR